MLKSVPLPPGDRLTARARAFAYPELSAAARAIIAASEADATETRLDSASLLEAARRQTGLSDFGDAPLVEPLNALCRSLRDEAKRARHAYMSRCPSYGMMSMGMAASVASAREQAPDRAKSSRQRRFPYRVCHGIDRRDGCAACLDRLAR